MAYLLDVMITLGLFSIASIAAMFLFGWIYSYAQSTGLGPLLDLIGGLAFAFFAVGAFLSLWFYGAIMETRYNGQTFGKMLTNIRSISSDGSAIDGTQATLRNFFRLMDVSPMVPMSAFFGSDFGMVPIPIFSIGLLCMILNNRYQRLGDLVAGTIVVSEQRKWTHGLVTFADERVPKLAELIPDGFVTPPSLAKALAEYVDRRQILPYERANEIATHLAKPLLAQFELQPDTNADLFLCAMYYKTFVEQSQDDLLNTDRSEAKPISDMSANPFAAEEIDQ